jgi:serine/threonine protein phosphatase PrpC
VQFVSEFFKYIESVERTDVGCKRKNNEDSLISLPEYGVFCVADGMGGAQDGEIASQAVVDAIEERFVSGVDSAYAVTAAASAKIVAMALNKASSWIEQRAQERGTQGSGSTAMVMVFDKVMPERAIVVHAGDSRAYLYRGKKLIQVSVDHSVATEAGVADENDLPPMLRGVITRAVGLKPQVAVEETPVEVQPNDIFMLCSDGLSRMLSDKKIAAIFKRNSREELKKLLDLLIDEALAAGGKDNVSVILIRIADELPEGPLMEVPEETRRIEKMRLDAADDESSTADTAGATGETAAADSGHSDPALMECATPGSDSQESDLRTPTANVTGPSVRSSGSRTLLLVLAAVVLTAALAAALYWLNAHRAG